MTQDESKIHKRPVNYSGNASTNKDIFIFNPPGLDKKHKPPSMALLKEAKENHL